MTKNNKVIVVFSANNSYVPYLGVCIHSLIKTSNIQYIYEINILHSDLSEINQKRLLSLQTKHISINIINIQPYVSNFKFYVHQYFTQETYYRLFIPQIFPEYDKVLYLDSDIIITHDVAELFATDLRENLIGATWNISTIVQAQTNQHIKNTPWRDYLKNILQLENPTDYFQAGVCLLNCKQMRLENTLQKLLIRAMSYNHPLVDQDILNFVCQKRITFLEQIWNFHNNFCESSHNMHLLELVPPKQKLSYLKAKKTIPYIIHYAGFIKPWNNPSLEYADIWWSYARTSIFYEMILYKNLFDKSQNDISTTKKEIIILLKNQKKIRYYKWMSRLTCGKLRKKYQMKYKNALEIIKSAEI